MHSSPENESLSQELIKSEDSEEEGALAPEETFEVFRSARTKVCTYFQEQEPADEGGEVFVEQRYSHIK